MSLRALFFGETPHRLAGAQRSLLAALTRLPAHGVDPEVVFPGEGVVVDAYSAAGLRTRVLPAPPAYLSFNRKVLELGAGGRAQVVLREILPYCWRLSRIVARERFDVVHFNTPRGILEAGLAARLAGRPAVLHLRGAARGIGSGVWLAAQSLASRIVLVARALEGDVARPFRRRCSVVYNGVVELPARDRLAARRALGERLCLPQLAPSGEALFVSLSSLTPFKGLHHLLDAAVLLRQRGIPARYVLCGGGGDARYEGFLTRRVASLGLGDLVHTMGFVPEPLAVLAAADALVLPSVARERLALDDGTVLNVHGTEGLPRSILEAMALGVPAVASRVEGVVEQLDDGETGLVVAPGDPHALADALARVAGDDAWREQAGARARAVVRSRFSVDRAAAGLARVLADTVS